MQLLKLFSIGALQLFGGWAVVSALLVWYFQTDPAVSGSAAVGISVFGGLLLWVAIVLIASSIARLRERATILRGVEAIPPKEGNRSVIVGRIESIGESLQAPLDGSACVAYSYSIRIDIGAGKSRSNREVARGVALTPSRIVNTSGAYKLLAVPTLIGVTPNLSKEECIANFLAYAKHTVFIQVGKASARELQAQWSDCDGAYRSDVSYESFEGARIDKWYTAQHCVPNGSTVCVFGRYSKADGGIVPSITTPTRLIAGDVNEIAATLRGQAMTRAIIACVLIAITGGLVLMNQ
jgi:hypothetical protein